MKIVAAVLPEKLKLPPILKYSEDVDLVEHASKYHDWKKLYRIPDALMCKVFPAFLTRPARSWFDSLPLESIISFANLIKKIFIQLAPQRTRKKATEHLTIIAQCRDEPVRDYLQRFTQEANMVEGVSK